MRTLQLLFLFLFIMGFKSKPVGAAQLGYWDRDRLPVVWVCEDAPVSDEQVAEAMNWWEAQGYTFSGMIHGYCYPQRYYYGRITIGLRGQGFLEESGGSTLLKLREGKIKNAEILLRDGHQMVLIHELGHAIGWGHTGGKFKWQRGHIMNPEKVNLGEDAVGVSRGDYQAIQ